jgi:hypothetical protein
MRRRHVILVNAVLLLVVFAVGAEDFEYGAHGDLKGLTRYYLDTRTDINTRNDLASKIRGESSQLQLSDLREEAQIFVDVAGHISCLRRRKGQSCPPYSEIRLHPLQVATPSRLPGSLAIL